MSIKREDGPVKHYRMKCDSCGKETKRFTYEFNFEYDGCRLVIASNTKIKVEQIEE